MNKKGKGTGIKFALWGIFVLLLIAVVGGGIMWLKPSSQIISGENKNAPSSSGNIVIQTSNPSDTVTLTFQAVDALNTVSGKSYVGTTLYPVIDGVSQSSVAIDGTIAGGSKTGVGLGKTVNYFIENTSSHYTEYGSVVADAPKTKEVLVTSFGVPSIKVWDTTAGSYVGTWNSTTNTTTIPSIGLVAGGAPKTYDIYLSQDSAYKAFGKTNIVIGCNVITDSKYTTTFTGANNNVINPETSLPTSFQDLNVKKAWKTGVSSVTGFQKIGSLTLKLNGGQTGSTITCYIADEANFRSVDGVTLKTGINRDDSSATDIGAPNPSIVFTV